MAMFLVAGNRGWSIRDGVVSRLLVCRLDLPALNAGESGLNTFLLAVVVCFAAVVLDWLVGEPRRWHPLVGFGRGAAALERWLNRQPERSCRSLAGGILGVVLLTAPVMAVAWLLSNVLNGWAWLAAQVIVLWSALSVRGLAEHGKAVSEAQHQGDGDRARVAVGRIVSRDAIVLS